MGATPSWLEDLKRRERNSRTVGDAVIGHYDRAQRNPNRGDGPAVVSALGRAKEKSALTYQAAAGRVEPCRETEADLLKSNPPRDSG